ncbi:putative lipid II flippase FtsW [bacterium]|nr:putative lipid II flippase FtsW [bacterium]
MKVKVQGIDLGILFPVILLLAVSVLMVFSTTAMLTSSSAPAALVKSANVYIRSHLFHMILGLVAAYLVMLLPLDKIEKYAPYLFAGLLLMLVIVLVPGVGVVAGGARRWIDLKVLRFQPGEFMKLAIVVFISAYMAKHQDRVNELVRGIFIPLGLTAITVLLLLLEPDFGSTSVILLLVIAILLLGGVSLLYLLGLGAVVSCLLATLIALSPYRLKRFTAFLDPFQDPSKSGYQLIQSLIAVGSGGITGVGLGASEQKLFYLPAAHTDFIYAVIAEELGFIGALGVLLLYLLILIRGMRVCRHTKSWPFASILAGGLTLLICLPAFLNIAVVTGLLPTKGMVLPLISYGGSAMIMNLLAVGLLLKLSLLIHSADNHE